MPTSKYQADDGRIYRIRLKQVTLTAAGAVPSGNVTAGAGFVQIGKSNSAFGIRPRGWIAYRTVGTAPDTFVKTTFIPKLTEAAFNADLPATLEVGDKTYTSFKKRAEDTD